jgi:hypothetical protein
MRRHTWLTVLLCSPALLGLTGCANPPDVQKGTFAEEKTSSIRRGLIDAIVEPGGKASYVVSQWPYTHPMGPPGDTEIVVTTPAGKFTIENRGLGGGKFRINGQEYEYHRPPDGGRMKMRIDKEGKVKMISEKAPAENAAAAPPDGK